MTMLIFVVEDLASFTPIPSALSAFMFIQHTFLLLIIRKGPTGS